MTAAPTSKPIARLTGRMQLILLAVLFFAPFVAAWTLYFYFPDARPAGTTNYGQLVTPPKSMPDWEWSLADGSMESSDTLRGKWLLLQVVGADCDALCSERLLTTRQMRIALAGERERVQRVVLSTDPATLPALQARLAEEHPDVVWRAVADIEALQSFFGSRDVQALFLVDPLGNFLMTYPGGRPVQADFKGMQKDINKLLKLSRIG
jgi:cytochrome oxidase Cu insertion factor (SCO1/SenC/PrrC family)